MEKNDGDSFRLSDLNNEYNSYEELCVLAEFIMTSKAEQVVLDFSNVNFVAANLYSVLGCLFSEKFNGKKLSISNIKQPVKRVIQKNGFYQHFIGLKGLPDRYKTMIPYRVFGVEDIHEYDNYLTFELFGRDDLPKMSVGVRDSIRDYLLEVFKNVNDHTECQHIYTCGQYFPRTKMLYFTLVDSGKTIYENVHEYHRRNNKSCPECCLEWATGFGNTTVQSKTPRGLGLHYQKKYQK